MASPRDSSQTESTLDCICVQMSRDEATILIVSYSDLKACAERSFTELLQQGHYQTTSAGRTPLQQFPDTGGRGFGTMDFGIGAGMGMRSFGGGVGGPEQQWSAQPSGGRGSGGR